MSGKVSFQSWLIKQPVVVSVPVYSGGLCTSVQWWAVYGGSSPAEEAGDGKTDWTGSCLGFQAFLLSANVQGGRDPPTQGNQLT